MTLLAAGHAAGADPQPKIQVESAEARVRVELDPQEATLFRRAAVATFHGSDGAAATGYDEVCSGDCKLKMAAGSYAFSLEVDGKMTAPKRVSIPDGDSTLHVRYESHSGMRTFGWVLAGTSPVTAYGALMGMKAANGGKPVSGGQTALGLGLGAVQLAIGLVLVFTNKDILSFEVVRAQTAIALPNRAMSATDWALPKPQELGLAFAF